MPELNVEHVLLFVILAVLLYHLIGGCGCGGNGFRVGGESDPICNGKEKAECNLPNCVYGNGQCNNVCVDKDYCHNNGLCKIIPSTNEKYCECGEDWARPNCKKSAIPDDCLNGNNRHGQSCQTTLNGCCPNLGGYCNDTTGRGYGTCTW